jgi:glycerol-1-phosphate dehydrogenase [NAD(P)+]
VVAGADWLLADAVGEEPLAREPFGLVQDNVKRWLSEPARIAAHDADALHGLMDGLLISGFAMQAHGNSRPASGSDHQLAHVWDMDHVTVDGEPAAHGACVGVGAVAMTALYEWLLAQDVAHAADGVDVPVDRPHVEQEIAASFPEPALVASARAEMTAKLDRAPQRAARMRTLAARWDDLRKAVSATLLPADTLAQWLRECGAASHPADLGISMDKLAADYRRARLIRRRYTILDCLEDLGWLDRAIAALFAPGGYWGRGPA